MVLRVEIDNGVQSYQEESLGGPTRKGVRDRFTELSDDTATQVSGLIEESWSGFVTQIRGIPNPPSGVELEFGIDVGGEAGIPFVTKGTVGAHLKVKLIWDGKG